MMIKLIYPMIFLLIVLQSSKGSTDAALHKTNYIKENATYSNHKIEKIEYSTTMCFGTCPVFSLTINSDKNAEWNAEKYSKINNKEVNGKFHSKITKKQYNKLIGLLNSIDLEKLKDESEVDWTDLQSSTLKIAYDNGKVKSIHDYGMRGTDDLKRIYQLLFELREIQKWKKQP